MEYTESKNKEFILDAKINMANQITLIISEYKGKLTPQQIGALLISDICLWLYRCAPDMQAAEEIIQHGINLAKTSYNQGMVF